MSGLALGVTVGLGAVETTVGLINKGKAKKEAAKLAANRPKLTDSPYIKDELSLAKSDLSNGMSAEAKSAYEGGLSRDLSTSLNTILKSGGSVNNVSQVFDSSAQGRQRLGLIKENLRLNNVNNLIRAQDTAENERQQEFQFDNWAPWVDAAKANGQARQAADAQIWSGIDTAGGGLIKKFGGGNMGDTSGANPKAFNTIATNSPAAPNYNTSVPSMTNRQAPVNAPNMDLNYPDYSFNSSME